MTVYIAILNRVDQVRARQNAVPSVGKGRVKMMTGRASALRITQSLRRSRRCSACTGRGTDTVSVNFFVLHHHHQRQPQRQVVRRRLACLSLITGLFGRHGSRRHRAQIRQHRILSVSVRGGERQVQGPCHRRR